MEEICSSETSIDFRRNTRRYILEDNILQQTSYWDLIMWSRSAGLGTCLHIVGYAVAVGHITYTYLLTELSPSWEAANCAAIQEIPSNFK
jgi:hypothetical protein